MADATQNNRATLAQTPSPLAGFEVFVALAIVALLAWSFWSLFPRPENLPPDIRGATHLWRKDLPFMIRHNDARIRRRAAILAGELATKEVKKALVNALDDRDRFVRRLAIASLLKMNGGESFGYDPDAPESKRAAAQEKWRKWFQPRRRAKPATAQADRRPKPPTDIDKEALRQQIERNLGIQPTWGPRIENLPADLRE